jgi:WD40 repeat protein
VRTIEGHERGVDSIAFSADGTLLASGGRDSLIKLWEVESGELVGELTAHSKPILTLAFHPAGNMLASGSGDNTVRVWGVTSLSTNGKAMGTL